VARAAGGSRLTRRVPGARAARWPGLFACAAAVSLGACATSLYSGPRLPDSETMLVETDGTQIVTIDDLEPPSGSKFRLLPGRHHVEVLLKDTMARRSSRFSQPLCFTGRPGHAYLIQPVYYTGRSWSRSSSTRTGRSGWRATIARRHAVRSPSPQRRRPSRRP